MAGKQKVMMPMLAQSLTWTQKEGCQLPQCLHLRILCNLYGSYQTKQLKFQTSKQKKSAWSNYFQITEQSANSDQAQIQNTKVIRFKKPQNMCVTCLFFCFCISVTEFSLVTMLAPKNNRHLLKNKLFSESHLG